MSNRRLTPPCTGSRLGTTGRLGTASRLGPASRLDTASRLGPRRVLMAILVIGISALLLALGWHVLRGGGWTVWEVLIFACLTLNAP